ncbi:MAG: N-acetylmuramoyl-L-alanine amidase, partial [Gemmobacter sp.]|nr:N-acetylmuramoyl-L-alanine amidase [Gemmobacter sp.]
APQVLDLRAGAMRPGWSRLVLELDAPSLVGTAEMKTGDAGALVRVRLRPADQAAFAERAAEPDPETWRLPRSADTRAARSRQRGQGPLLVVLDPGHGGIDPGAQSGNVNEADLMLRFARELKEVLTRTGEMQVVLTREADVFVPLESRIAVAHAVEADVFLSLHADALTEGQATGATVYTMSEAASDAASAALAERHDRDALLSGVDLTGQDDLIAGVLMELARVETAPRAERMADALVAALRGQQVRLHKVPKRGAAFSVLKSPDIPSVLLEIGYLSPNGDLARLTDPAWRARVAAAVAEGLAQWRVADAAEAALLRQ